MVLHQALNNSGAKGNSFRIGDGDACAVGGRRHACHDELALRVLFVAELFYGALAARTHRAQCRMPAEIRKIKTQ